MTSKENNIQMLKCPECGSTEYAKAGKVWIARQKVQRYRCTKCGRLFISDKPRIRRGK